LVGHLSEYGIQKLFGTFTIYKELRCFADFLQKNKKRHVFQESEIESTVTLFSESPKKEKNPPL
jgi:hypothetical protein